MPHLVRWTGSSIPAPSGGRSSRSASSSSTRTGTTSGSARQASWRSRRRRASDPRTTRIPEKTAKAYVRPGAFTLGDMGHVDENGFIFITDRLSDMVVSGGVNLYPSESEAVLRDHPGVADVAVIGIPHADLGEQLLALIVPADLAAPAGRRRAAGLLPGAPRGLQDPAPVRVHRRAAAQRDAEGRQEGPCGVPTGTPTAPSADSRDREEHMLKGIAGRTAIVTGAAGGIGSATARRLHAEGANVVARRPRRGRRRRPRGRARRARASGARRT